MAKYLFISGSPRKGNTDYVLNQLFERLDGTDKEIIFLREKKISRCGGCLVCDKTKKCVIRDDMDEILEKLKSADVIVIGTPNYFDNVPGLVKDFIDRTNPLYETDLLKGKKVFAVVVGGGKVENSRRVIDGALKYFVNAKKMDLVGAECFKGLQIGEVENDPESCQIIESISAKLKSL